MEKIANDLLLRCDKGFLGACHASNGMIARRWLGIAQDLLEFGIPP